MPFNSISEITLEQAIVRNPLVVSPNISVAEAISCMSAARATCNLLENPGTENNILQTDARASCLVVVQENQVIGIFTERDVVRLSANECLPTNPLLVDVMTRAVITLHQAEFTDIFSALQLLQRYRIRHLPVLDDQGQLVGLLTHETLRQLLRPVDLLRLRVVSEVMTYQVIHASPDTSILKIAQLMALHRVSSVVVVETQVATTAEPESGSASSLLVPVGIVTENDIVQFRALNLNFKQIQAQQVMSTPVFTVRPHDSLWAAQQWMQQKQLSRVVVAGDQGELLGIVTQSTLLQAMNPVEIYKLVEVLEQKASRLEAEKMELLQNRNAKLEELVQQRTADLKKQAEREQLLSTIATRISASLELDNILNTVVTEVQQFLQCDRMLVYQFNQDWSGRMRAEAVLPGWQSALENQLTDCCFREKADQLYAEGIKHAVSNIYEAGYPDCYIQLLERYQVRASLVVPILVEDQLWGLLIGHQCRETRLWESSDLDLLDRIGVQVAIAIQQSQAYEKAQREIRERQQVEASLKQSEATNRAILEGIPDLLIRMDSQGRCHTFLSGGTVQTVVPHQNIPNSSIRDVLPEHLATQRLHYTALALSTQQLQVYEQQIEINGEWYEEEVRITPLNEAEVLVIIRDITERKKAEAALRQSEAKNRALISALPDLIMRLSGEGKYLDFFSTDTFPVLGDRNLIGVGIHDRGLPPELSQLRMSYIQQALETRKLQIYEQQIAMGREIRTEEVRIVVCADDEVLVVVRDITDRKQAEDALRQLNQELESRINQRTIELRQSEERFRQIFEQSPIGIAISDLEGQLTRVNSSLVHIVDYTKSELLQRSIQDILTATGQQQGVQRLQELLEQTLSVMTFEAQVVSGQGETVWVNVTSALIFNAFGRPSSMIHLIEDVTSRKQMEFELRELTLSLQNAMEGIARLDEQGRYVSLNRAYAQPCGYEPEELIGAEWQITVYPEDIPAMEAAYQTMFEQGRVEAETRGIRKDGSLFHKQVTMVTALDQAGQFSGHYCFLKDISERTQLEAERQATELALKRQLAVIEAAIDGIAILEGDTYTYLNQAHLKMFGYQQPEELLGRNWKILYSPEELERFEQEIFPVLLQQHYWHGEAIATRKDGSIFNEGLSLTLTDSGALICVCRDITEQKQAEVKICKANEQLLLANAELARATRLKDEFLANMSHELRTPLNAILGMSEGLQEGVFGEIHPAQERAVATIDRSGRHLLELINDILDLSKIESGKLELQLTPIPIKYLCENSLTFVRQLAIRKNLRLTSEIRTNLSDVCVDERRLRQVLINLLNNAIKFTPEGGSVQLIVSEEIRDDHCSVLFQVRDTGIGIAPENFSKLFNPFVQIDSSLNRQYAGTGLGLSLVKQLTQLHGGTVTLTSEVGKGSCFTVQIPYTSVSETPAPPVPRPTEQMIRSVGKTVLVIEDTPSVAEQTTRYLAEVGLDPVVHSVGKGALEAAIAAQPALIILDILLPDLPGWEVLAQLKSHPQTQSIPVVVASVIDERSQAMALGASHSLVKPISRDQLYAILQSLQVPITPSSAPRSSTPKSAISNPLILLAEDNAANMATLSAYLKNRGFQVMLAQDGTEAIVLTEAHHPDLILMDVQMPKVDGLSAIRQIRANPAIAHIPIIALTALAMPHDRENCIDAGATEYLTKPVKLRLLVEVIQRLL